MIESFKIMNFKSYFDETTVDFTASASLRAHQDHLINKGSLKLIKMNGVFGANSAGKTNLIKALKVVHSFAIGNANASAFIPFASNKNGEDSEFNLRFITDRGNHLEYTIRVGRKHCNEEIILEKLTLLNDQSCDVFERNSKTIDEILQDYSDLFLNKSDENYVRLKNKLNLLKKYSFLSQYWSNNCGFYSKDILSPDMDDVMNDVKEWFLNTIQFIDTSKVYLPKYESVSIEKMSEYICDFGADIEEIYWEDIDDLKRIDKIIHDFSDELSSSGMGGLSNDSCKEYTTNKSIILSNDANIYNFILKSGAFYIRELRVKHKHNSKYDSSISTESMGTRRMIQLISTLLKDYRSKVYIIDELNYKLHPMMTKRFIELFGQSDNNAQLIFTSHEMNIFTSDLFRFDEITVVDKDNSGHSKLTKVSDYDNIMGDTLENMYLEYGEFGGIPKF